MIFRKLHHHNMIQLFYCLDYILIFINALIFNHPVNVIINFSQSPLPSPQTLSLNQHHISGSLQ